MNSGFGLLYVGCVDVCVCMLVSCQLITPFLSPKIAKHHDIQQTKTFKIPNLS